MNALSAKKDVARLQMYKSGKPLSLKLLSSCRAICAARRRQRARDIRLTTSALFESRRSDADGRIAACREGRVGRAAEVLARAVNGIPGIT